MKPTSAPDRDSTSVRVCPHPGAGTRACTRSSAACPRPRPTAGCAGCPTLANHGRLWLVLGALLGIRKGPTAPRRDPRASARWRCPARSSTSSSSGSSAGSGRTWRTCSRTAGCAARRARLSFPSGHSASAAAFVTGVAMESPLAGAALAPVALGVGYSRVHVGVHYPGRRRRRARRRRRGRGGHPALVAGAARPSRPGCGRRTRRPALPEGEGLVVAVNPRSGPDDYDPAADIAQLLPRAEVLEMSEDAGVDELLGEAARSGRAKALGRGRRRRQRRGRGRGRARARAAAGGHRRRARSTTSPATSAWRPRRTPRTPSSPGQAVQVDVAEVNGTPFLNTSSIGAYPEMVRRRDQLSRPAWASGWR